jgi:hypothetical protein
MQGSKGRLFSKNLMSHDQAILLNNLDVKVLRFFTWRIIYQNIGTSCVLYEALAG